MARFLSTHISLTRILFAGLVAGIVAAVIQIVLWWLFSMPLPETLFRDIRFVAAIFLGADIIAAPLLRTQPSLVMVVIATVMHFALSFAIAVVYAWLEQRVPALLRNAYAILGALFGLAIYVIGMYGLPVLFPWFAHVRDLPTLLTHLVFGATLAIALRPGGFANPRRRKESRLSQDTILG